MPLQLEHVRMYAETEHADVSHCNATSNESTSTAWCGRTISAETVCDVLEFDIVIGADGRCRTQLITDKKKM